MANIDTTPSTVATSALQAIPFGTLIGGPLDACVQAQAQAAQTTVNFIQSVGLNSDGSAKNVQFTYVRNGQQMTLTVPLLIIVPIPYIAINTIAIDFKANISAAASTVSTDTSSTSMGGAANVAAKVGWGPFSVSADFAANYSSKKDSTATAKSQYSVEYTMDVTVNGGQSDMPTGLATVLNILQSSVNAAPACGTIALTSPSGVFGLDANAATTNLTVNALFTDASGLPVSGVPVNFSLSPSASLTTLAGLVLSAASATTSASGVASVTVSMSSGNQFPLSGAPYSFPLYVNASLPNQTQPAAATVGISVVPQNTPST